MYIKNNIFEVEALPHGSLTPGGKANGGGRKGGKAKGVGHLYSDRCPHPLSLSPGYLDAKITAAQAYPSSI